MSSESTAGPTPVEGAHNRIPDAAVEAAARAAWNYRVDAAGGVPWDEARMLHGEALDPFTWQHRAALEAALPHLQATECPSCHTHAGHPHTDYCQNVTPAEYPGQPDHCTYDPELPGMWEAADLAGGQADTAAEPTPDQGWCHECGKPQHP